MFPFKAEGAILYYRVGFSSFSVMVQNGRTFIFMLPQRGIINKISVRNWKRQKYTNHRSCGIVYNNNNRLNKFKIVISFKPN